MNKFTITIFMLWVADKNVRGFSPNCSFQRGTARSYNRNNHFHSARIRFAALPKYGPSSGEDGHQYSPKEVDESKIEDRKREFRLLVDQVLSVKDPTHIPSYLTKQIPLVLDIMSGGERGVGIVQDILAKTVHEQGEAAGEQVSEAIDIIFSFAEGFVEEAVGIDNSNKELLGKIIRTISDQNLTEREREDSLDRILSQENLTAGFLRHLEGECERIANSPRITKESSRLLQILRIIQARVVEELSGDLGEAAQVLGPLVGYDDLAECLAVLDAGLTVRGLNFASEMKSLTREALDGFSGIPGGVDPGLVKRVQAIDERLGRYVQSKTSSFE
jgi:hypothetical protein